MAERTQFTPEVEACMDRLEKELRKVKEERLASQARITAQLVKLLAMLKQQITPPTTSQRTRGSRSAHYRVNNNNNKFGQRRFNTGSTNQNCPMQKERFEGSTTTINQEIV